MFNTNFFYAEAMFSLDQTRQHAKEDLDAYVRIFQEPWTCCDSVVEEVLVNVASTIYWKYHIFLKKFSSLSFLRLMLTSRRTKESMFSAVQPIPDSMIRPTAKKNPVCNLRRLNEPQHAAWRSQPMARESLGNSLSCTISLWREASRSSFRMIGETSGHYHSWDRLSPLSWSQKDARCWPYHGRTSHTLKLCVTFKRILDEIHKAREIRFQDGG